MEWLNKIPNWIKIPIKVLLPALTIFSGLLLFLGDNAIAVLHLTKFRDESGFAFGLLFVITLSLEIVYIAYFIYDKYKEKSIANRVAKRLLKGNKEEFWLLVALYNEPKKSAMFPMNDGMIARLEGKHYIAKFAQPFYQMRLVYFMQPFVEWAIDSIFCKMEKDKMKTEKQIDNCKDAELQAKMQQSLNEQLKLIKKLRKVSISDFYDQTKIF